MRDSSQASERAVTRPSVESLTLATGSVRQRAAAALDRTLSSKTSAEVHLAAAAEGLGAADRRLLFELVLGSLRWLRRLDWTLGGAAGRSFGKVEPAVRAPLRIAAYQLLFLDRIPSYAAVDEAVTEVRRRGRKRAVGFANAVLRRLAGRRSLDDWPVSGACDVERLGIESSHPDFMVRRWLERFGAARTRELLAANNEPKPMHVLCMASPVAVAAELRAEGVETSRDVLSPVGLEVRAGDPLQTEAFKRGRIYIQDDASQASALVPPPRPGERILDVAASPGGKSFALAAAEPSVALAAADVSLSRLLTLRENRRRLDRQLRLLVADARRPALSSAFDRVICDLPCSGTGTIARHPELKWRLSPQGIDALASRGATVLHSASDLVCEGGILCMITCSLEPEENEGMVNRFLQSDSRFSLLALDGRVPQRMVSGVETRYRWRVLTTSRHDGFTVHVLRRRRRD